ncbi:30S ribosomal protein S8 [Methanoplanus sp. FWC-SCC4]|uniref:Small ribosomal subunit protein uS8 n=1 Tax=Methanochimaera problematica TaxID=2609417 RepID=A0AA97FCG0_9EURY|nr:30S ribosomal protein S8 [Methanoplanus sp. FWC-SCC4]WOF15503.1 30S ribosomal protein S8 [Methanoplanus sp. FWC-SCC4]
MTRLNPIADAMSAIKNASDVGKTECIVEPAGKLLGAMLGIMKEENYIESFELIDDGRGGQFRISLNGNINKCGVISPRFAVSVDELEKWENQYLPAKNFGILLITTSKGVLSHENARRLGVGGELLGYVY